VNHDIELSHVGLLFRYFIAYITASVMRQGGKGEGISETLARQLANGCDSYGRRGGAMIRPEFRKILLDQRGAAVILWSCFVISIPIYIVIARNVLGNPNIGSHRSFAETARIVLWLLAVIDMGYYVYWRKRKLSNAAILREARSTKLLRALEELSGPVEEQAAYVVSTYVTRKVVIFAIIEAIAVYGLVSGILGRFVSDLYFLSTISVVLLIIEFPSQNSLEELLKAVEQSPSDSTT
jgi:hypothetical protein